jgi:hypothetical protein
MRIIVKGKPLRYRGKLYLTGDAANVSRQHARVLTAIKRAEIPSTPAPTQEAAPPVVQDQTPDPQVAAETASQRLHDASLETALEGEARARSVRTPSPRVSREPKAKQPK